MFFVSWFCFIIALYSCKNCGSKSEKRVIQLRELRMQT